MRSILGVLLVCLAFNLLMLELAVLGGMQEMPMAGPGGPAWWVHAAMFLAVGVAGWFGGRMLSGSYLGRLVRGRGFTPEPVRR